MEFLRDYLSEKTPQITICPKIPDLIKVQMDIDRMEGAHRNFTEGFLENNAIHALLAEKLVSHDVLLMHGSALCIDGEAVIFTAPSGTGKSTHSRLWREVFDDRVWMINDDKPLLNVTETGITVYGTPWDGKHRLSRNACAPLKAIVSLERGEENHIGPISHAEKKMFQ